MVKRWNRLLVAFYVVTDALFGMMRMFEVFAEGQFRKTQAFRTVGEAEVWLTLERQPQIMASSVM